MAKSTDFAKMGRHWTLLFILALPCLFCYTAVHIGTFDHACSYWTHLFTMPHLCLYLHTLVSVSSNLFAFAYIFSYTQSHDHIGTHFNSFSQFFIFFVFQKGKARASTMRYATICLILL